MSRFRAMPYAKALLDVVHDQCPERAEDVGEELHKLAAAFEAVPELHRVLVTPMVSVETKTAILGLQDDPVGQRFFALAFGLRPAEELYDLRADPHQLVNLAGEPRLDARKQRLSAALTAELESTGDPRAVGDGEEFDSYPYYGRSRR